MMKLRTRFAAGAVALVGLLGFSVVLPVQHAEALACYSSLTCQPANIPLVVESGVLVAPKVAGGVGAASTAAVAAKGSAGFIWGKLKTAASGFLLVTTLIDMFGADQTAGGGLSTDGVKGQRILTDTSIGTEVDFSGGSAVLDYGGGRTFTASVVGTVGTRTCVKGVWTGAETTVYLDQFAASWSSSPFSRNNRYDPCSGPFGKTDLLSGFSAVYGGSLVTKWRVSAGAKVSDPVSGSIGGPVAGVAAVTLKCQSLTTGTVRTVTASLSQTFQSGGWMTVPDTGCLPGEIAVGADVDWTPDGGSAVRVIEDDGEQVLPSQKELPDEFPDCFGASGVGCVMTLEHLVGSEWQSCGEIGQLCEDWVTDPKRATVYRCKYGSTVISIDYCSAYRKPSLGVLPNVDSAGNLLTPDAAVPTLQQPGTLEEPGTDTQPEWERVDCRPASWLDVLNPFWVFRAVQCSWEWATVASPSAVSSLRDSLRDRFTNSSLGRVAAAIASIEWPVSGLTGCEGIDVSLAWLKRDAFASADFPESFNLFSACEGEPLHPFAVFSSLLLTVGMGFVALKTWPSLIGRIVNYSGVDG